MKTRTLEQEDVLLPLASVGRKQKTRTITYRIVVPKDAVSSVTYALTDAILNTGENVIILGTKIRKSNTKEKRRSKKWAKKLAEPLKV